MTYTRTLGAIPAANGRTRFRAWAPARSRVELATGDESGPRVLLARDDDGYWEAELEAPAGTRYRYWLDGEGPFPDPCSRFQPEGVHGPSEVVDPGAFAWQDSAFRRPMGEDLVIYEAHIGTLTPEGTLEAAQRELPRLRDLGVTAIELMPVAAFAGEHGWGYDGAAFFAPHAPYGGPEALRRFVDAAHRSGLAVLLDVVYNHFGPDGNYTGVFCPYYVTDRHHTPWGDAINFDGEHSVHVRRFFTENLLHWVHEYHIDGFRFDATQAMIDESPVHILAELRDTLDAHCERCRGVLMIAETHENDVRYQKPRSDGGRGFDAVWTDDFHHILRNNLRDERDGYLGYFEGTPTALCDVISQGWYYEGQVYPENQQPRGTPAREQPWRQFVYFMQNHDQVGNRAFGDRLSATVSRDDILAATTLFLCLPQTPMLFQGQEWLADEPFQYFSNHNDELGPLVSEGRRREFAHFRAFADEQVRAVIPDPQDPATFHRSKLDSRRATSGLAALTVAFHRDLLRLRRDDPVLRAMRTGRPPFEARVEAEYALSVTMRAAASWRCVVLNLGKEPVLVALPGEGRAIFASNAGGYGGIGEAPTTDGACATVAPRAAAVFAPAGEGRS